MVFVIRKYKITLQTTTDLKENIHNIDLKK